MNKQGMVDELQSEDSSTRVESRLPLFPMRVCVAYGSQTGNSREIAGRLAHDLSDKGLEVQYRCLDQFRKVCQPSVRVQERRFAPLIRWRLPLPAAAGAGALPE